MREHRRLQWAEPPKADPEQIVQFYLRYVKDIPGVVRIAAEVRSMTLHIYTLIKPIYAGGDDREVERRLYEAELRVAQEWPGVEVEFRVYQEGDWLPRAFESEGPMPVHIP